MIPLMSSNQLQENQMFANKTCFAINGYQQNNFNKRIKLDVNNSNNNNKFVTNIECDEEYKQKNTDNIEELLNDEEADNYCSQMLDICMANNTLIGSAIGSQFNSNFTHISDHMIIGIVFWFISL